MGLQPIVIVTGPYGADLITPVSFLRSHGFLQSPRWGPLRPVYGDQYYPDNIVHPTLVNMHEQAIGAVKGHWAAPEFPAHVPRFVYPGPAEWLEAFKNESVVLADPRFCLMMHLWQGRYTHVVYVDNDRERTAQLFSSQVCGWNWPKFSKSSWLRNFEIYASRFDSFNVPAIRLPAQSADVAESLSPLTRLKLEYDSSRGFAKT